jgi:tetraacyldisaccharide 4'-kinase
MKAWHWLLAPLTPVYAAAVRVRARGYASGLLHAERLPVPVISVGNLSFGGTGKTPTVISLVRDLVRHGRRPAVLTRGYGRQGSAPLILVGPEVGLPSSQAGDEPLELASRLPGVPIVVDAERVRGGRLALARGADTLVLDDGFQHLALARDLDLVLVDAGDPWAGGRLPPRGRLREPLSSLRRASAVVVTKLPEGGPGEDRLASIRATVAGLAPGLPVLGARLAVTRLHTLEGRLGPEALAGQRVLAFAGIGRPGGFEELLGAAGAEIVASDWLRDHHPYRPAEVAGLVARAETLDAAPVTTAKDAVKLPVGAPVWVVEVEMVPLEGTWRSLWRLLREAVPGSIPDSPEART